MKTKLLYGNLFCAILLFTGCAKDDNAQFRSGAEATISLNVNSQVDASTDPESQVGNVRVTSFFPANSATKPGVLDVNGGKQNLPVSGIITQRLNTGVRDVYVFVNEERVNDITTRLNTAQSLDEMKTIRIPYAPPLAPPFLGSCIEPNLDIKKEENAKVQANVVRTVSKVNLTLTYEWGQGRPLPDKLIIKSVQVMKLPTYSYLIGKLYDGDNYVNSEAIADPTELKNTLTGTAATYQYKSKPLIIYIPEFLGATATNHVYLEIKGEVANAGIECTYKIPLGNGMQADGSIHDNNYAIARNTEFSIAATIKSYGENDGVSIKVTVLPWNTVNQDEQTGRFIAYNKVTDGADKPIADGSELNDLGTTLKVTCNTNIGGWYTITRDADNTIVHRSSPTASVSVAALQTVNITIPKLTDIFYGHKYTVSIYHPTIAMESVGPVKSLNFTQRGGFIPNSVLVQSFTVDGITYAGWPADMLPKTGLLLAKRGNQILPSGVAETQDPQMWLKTTNTLTAGVETVTSAVQAKLGMGKSSTDAMVATPALAADHPAANYCREMGPDWYLPSLAELALIYNNKSTFGTSYTFGATSHWSATQLSSSYSWYVGFNGGFTRYNTKPFNFRVRCVREI